MGNFICFERHHASGRDWKHVVFRFALTSRKFQDVHILIIWADLMEEPGIA